METLSQVRDQLNVLFQQHVPPVALVSTAVTFIVIGLGMSVLGAKLARFAMTTAFALAGAVGGTLISQNWSVSAPVSILLTCITGGVIGFFFHRLWIGVATAGLFAAVAGGGFGVQSLLPSLSSYERMPSIVQMPETKGFSVPDLQTQKSYLNPEFPRWAQGFWDYAKAQDPKVAEKLSLVTAAAALVGFLVGALAVRFTLIVITALLGTAMVTSGVFALAQQYQPALVQSGFDRPQIGLLAWGVFLLGSLILQTLVTRSDKSPGPAPPRAKRG